MQKETWYRLLIWTAIGQIVYFTYGFWHSKKRQQLMSYPPSRRNSDIELVAAMQRLAVNNIVHQSDQNLNGDKDNRSESQLEPNLHENIVENNDPIQNTWLEQEISEMNENNISEEFPETIIAEHPAKVFTIT